VDLHRARHRSLRGLAGQELRHGGLARERRARLLERRRAERHEPGRLVVGGHVREHERDGLVLGDGPAKRVALLRVAAAGVEGGADRAGRLGGDAHPAALERGERDAEPLPDRPEPLRLRNLAPVERQRHGRAGPDAHLLLVAADDEPRGTPLDEEGGHFPSPRLRIGLRPHDDHACHVAARDPLLLSVEHPDVAAPDRARAHGGRVAAGLRLRQPERPRGPLARRDRRQEPAPLRLRAEAGDGLAHHVRHRRDHGRGAVGGGELHEREGVGHRARAGAAVRLGHVHGEQPQLAEAVHELAREAGAPVVLGGDRRDPFAREATGGVLDRLLELARLECHGASWSRR
jgi:hypothetical protein